MRKKQRREEKEREKGMDFCLTKYLIHTSKFFICRKISRHGADGFTSLPKEGALQILSPFKIHRLGLV
jgi:hypothetical protein